MRVVACTEEGRYGGPQAEIALLASCLQRLGVSTVVVAPDDAAARFRRELATGDVEFVPVGLRSLTRKPAGLTSYLLHFATEVRTLRRVFKRVSPELVHCKGSWQVKGIVAAHRLGIPTIWHLNDTFIARPIKAVFPLFARLASAFIVSCERTREYYLAGTRFAGRPCALVPPPVDTRKFVPEGEWHEALRDSPFRHRVLTVGNVNPRKDLVTFLRMAARVTGTLGDRIGFFVAGPKFRSQGSYVRELAELQAQLGLGNVEFLGAVDDVPAALRAADIFVCTSRDEAGPMTVWEALATGTPVVSTDVGDVKRYIGGSRPAGKVRDVGDADGLAEEVCALLRAPDHRRALGARGRRIAEENFDTAVVARRQADFYRRVVVRSAADR